MKVIEGQFKRDEKANELTPEALITQMVDKGYIEGADGVFIVVEHPEHGTVSASNLPMASQYMWLSALQLSFLTSPED